MFTPAGSEKISGKIPRRASSYQQPFHAASRRGAARDDGRFRRYHNAGHALTIAHADNCEGNLRGPGLRAGIFRPARAEGRAFRVGSVPLITLGAGTTSHAFYTSVFAAQSVTFQPAIEAATADQIIPMAEAGLGVGIVPEAFIRPFDGVCRIELLKPFPPRAVCIVKRKGQPLSVAARELERMLLAAGGEDG